MSLDAALMNYGSHIINGKQTKDVSLSAFSLTLSIFCTI